MDAVEKHASSGILSISTNIDTFQDLEKQDCTIPKCHPKKHNLQHKESAPNIIDSGNMSTTCIETSDEDDTSEMADLEQITQFSLVPELESSNDGEKEFTSDFHERAERLQLEVKNLREKLSKEVTLWKKEREEFQCLRDRSDALAFEEATAAARAAAAAYAVESPFSNDLGNIADITSEQSIRELAILEYEKNLARYQDSCALEQAEQRYNVYKRTLVDTYKKKLLEVERLCNEELEKIRESASYLQPFKQMVSQWSVDENNHGDISREHNEQLNMEQCKINEMIFDKDRCAFGRVDNEINMVPEIVSARFHSENAT